LSLSSAEVKERVELYLYSASVPLWKVIGLTLLFLTIKVGNFRKKERKKEKERKMKEGRKKERKKERKP